MRIAGIKNGNSSGNNNVKNWHTRFVFTKKRKVMRKITFPRTRKITVTVIKIRNSGPREKTNRNEVGCHGVYRHVFWCWALTNMPVSARYCPQHQRKTQLWICHDLGDFALRDPQLSWAFGQFLKWNSECDPSNVYLAQTITKKHCAQRPIWSKAPVSSTCTGGRRDCEGKGANPQVSNSIHGWGTRLRGNGNLQKMVIACCCIIEVCRLCCCFVVVAVVAAAAIATSWFIFACFIILHFRLFFIFILYGYITIICVMLHRFYCCWLSMNGQCYLRHSSPKPSLCEVPVWALKCRFWFFVWCFFCAGFGV